MGNSMTGSVQPSVGTTTPGVQACALLATRLGITVNAQVAPWHGLFGGDPTTGAQTTDDLPSDPRGTGNYTAALALAAGVPNFYHLMLGTNDARYTSNSAALFGSNLGTITSALAGTGAKVILSYDPAFDTSVGGFNTSGNLALLASYQAQIDSLVDNTNIFAGDKQAYSYFLANLGELYDGTHLSAAAGVPHLAAFWATAFAPILARYIAYTPPPPPSLPIG